MEFLFGQYSEGFTIDLGRNHSMLNKRRILQKPVHVLRRSNRVEKFKINNDYLVIAKDVETAQEKFLEIIGQPIISCEKIKLIGFAEEQALGITFKLTKIIHPKKVSGKNKKRTKKHRVQNF